MIRFHGVLAPNAKLRSKVVPAQTPDADAHPCDAQAHSAAVRLSWARLVKRVFDIDIERCPNCGGALKIIAVIADQPVIVRILSHLSLPAKLGISS